MSELQQEAVRMISRLSDENVSFLIEVIRRLMPQNDKSNIAATLSLKENEGIQALKRLNAARKEIWQYLPKDFDPEKELEEARAERFDSIG